MTATTHSREELGRQPIGYWSGEAYRRVAEAIRGSLAASGLTQPQWWILNRIEDPSRGWTRAGLVEELARDLGAWKLDPRIAFLSADEPLATPFGRLLRVDASLPWSLKALRQVLRERGVGTVEVRKRGSAVDVAELTTRLRLRGDARAVVVLTRVAGRPWVLVCAEAR